MVKGNKGVMQETYFSGLFTNSSSDKYNWKVLHTSFESFKEDMWEEKERESFIFSLVLVGQQILDVIKRKF